MLTTAFYRKYRKMVNVSVHLPFNLHGRSIIQIVFAFVPETGFEVHVVLFCLFFGGGGEIG